MWSICARCSFPLSLTLIVLNLAARCRDFAAFQVEWFINEGLVTLLCNASACSLTLVLTLFLPLTLSVKTHTVQLSRCLNDALLISEQQIQPSFDLVAREIQPRLLMLKIGTLTWHCLGLASRNGHGLSSDFTLPSLR